MRNPMQVLKAAKAFVRIARDPNELNQVFELSHGMADPVTLRAMAEALRSTPEASRALDERPRLRVDLDELRRLQPGTLGREFADHMIANGLDPAALPTLEGETPETFVRAHLYETHDVWHVATGFATDVPGELGLQAFYLAQLTGRLPAAILAAGMINTLLFRFDEKDARMQEIARGWLLGKQARPLFGVRWDRLWSTPLAEVRKQLGLDRGVESPALAA
jgi:ubiquinone biosynthesis protein Coq4